MPQPIFPFCGSAYEFLHASRDIKTTSLYVRQSTNDRRAKGGREGGKGGHAHNLLVTTCDSKIVTVVTPVMVVVVEVVVRQEDEDDELNYRLTYLHCNSCYCLIH